MFSNLQESFVDLQNTSYYVWGSQHFYQSEISFKNSNLWLHLGIETVKVSVFNPMSGRKVRAKNGLKKNLNHMNRFRLLCLVLRHSTFVPRDSKSNIDCRVWINVHQLSCIV